MSDQARYDNYIFITNKTLTKHDLYQDNFFTIPLRIISVSVAVIHLELQSIDFGRFNE